MILFIYCNRCKLPLSHIGVREKVDSDGTLHIRATCLACEETKMIQVIVRDA
jgi:RNase P subunit RPR2